MQTTQGRPGTPARASDESPPGPPPLGHWLVDPRLAPRPDARRRRILDKALELFNESGYTRTGIQDIALATEASVGSIYHHFGDKAGIATALYVHGLTDYQRGLLRELNARDADAEEVIRAIVSHHLRWTEQNQELARFLLTSRDPAVVEPSEEALAGMNARLFDDVKAWIERWAEAGRIRRMPFSLFHAVVLGPSQEFARHWLDGRANETIEEAVHELADAAWKAVRA